MSIDGKKRFLAPAFMRGVARRAGGSPHICNANMWKARFALQSGLNPSDLASLGHHSYK